MNIVERARVQVGADELWDTVGTFGGVGSWHPWLVSVDCSGEAPGAERTARSRDGVTVEHLDEVEPGRRYRYSILSTALPVEHWKAELRVEDEGDPRKSLVTWSAHFDLLPGADADATVGTIRRFMRAGLDHLRSSRH